MKSMLDALKGNHKELLIGITPREKVLTKRWKKGPAKKETGNQVTEKKEKYKKHCPRVLKSGDFGAQEGACVQG